MGNDISKESDDQIRIKELRDQIKVIRERVVSKSVEQGMFHESKGSPHEALNCFNKAIMINPECAIAYHYLGNIYQNQENFEVACACYKKVFELNAAATRLTETTKSKERDRPLFFSSMFRRQPVKAQVDLQDFVQASALLL